MAKKFFSSFKLEHFMDSPFRAPKYLSKKDEPRYRIRCPVHGFIHYSQNERRIIDHCLFQRLRFIKQLALTDLLYPGATHTRFEHSLGVMHVATLAFDRLAQSRGNILESVFRNVLEIREKPLAIARQIIRLAALLHDIGHAPFSHAAEKIIHEGADHEELTIKILVEPELLGKVLDQCFFKGCSKLVSNIISGVAALAPQLQILRNIVSGQMDADRTDYLLRDSLHCGVNYGRFDYLRMIESLELYEGEGGSLEVAINRGGIHTFEALILARYQMNTQIYYHQFRRIYDYYLNEYFDAKGRELFDSPDKILRQNDVTMMATILKDSQEKSAPGWEWAQRIIERKHHRLIHETGERTNAMDMNCSRQLLTELRNRFQDLDFRWDTATPKIHNLLLPDDFEIENYEQLQMIDSSGIAKQIGYQSHILRHVPRKFQFARIYCDLDEDNDNLRKEVTKFAVEKYREQGGQ